MTIVPKLKKIPKKLKSKSIVRKLKISRKVTPKIKITPKIKMPEHKPYIKTPDPKSAFTVPPAGTESTYKCPNCNTVIYRNYRMVLETKDMDETFSCTNCKKNWYVMWVDVIFDDRAFAEASRYV